MAPEPKRETLIAFFLIQAFTGQLAEGMPERVAHRMTHKMITGSVTMAQISDGLMSPRECEVWEFTLGLKGIAPLSDREIGQIFGLTADEVRRVRQQGLKKLQESIPQVSRFTD